MPMILKPRHQPDLIKAASCEDLTTPFQLAAWGGHVALCDFLLSQKAHQSPACGAWVPQERFDGRGSHDNHWTGICRNLLIKSGCLLIAGLTKLIETTCLRSFECNNHTHECEPSWVIDLLAVFTAALHQLMRLSVVATSATM